VGPAGERLQQVRRYMSIEAYCTSWLLVGGLMVGNALSTHLIVARRRELLMGGPVATSAMQQAGN
jgi:hypothetical protein